MGSSPLRGGKKEDVKEGVRMRILSGRISCIPGISLVLDREILGAHILREGQARRLSQRDWCVVKNEAVGRVVVDGGDSVDVDDYLVDDRVKEIARRGCCLPKLIFSRLQIVEAQASGRVGHSFQNIFVFAGECEYCTAKP